MYKEFFSTKDAEDWAKKQYAEVCSVEFAQSEFYDALYAYAGGLYVSINFFLRRGGELSIRANHVLKVLREQVPSCSVPENIVVYRHTCLKIIEHLCGDNAIKQGMRFYDKGFLSTSLLKKCALNFNEGQPLDCILKLYLPKGTKGVYICYKHSASCLNEQEILLAPEILFEIKGVDSIKKEISCVALI